MNKNRTCGNSDTPVTRDRSAPVRWELIGSMGELVGTFDTATEAAEYAAKRFPDQEQDEDHTGKGWDVQVIGCDRA